MTTATAAQSDAGFLAGVEPNAGFLAGFARAGRSYRAYRATLAELAALTDRQLSDTGFDPRLAQDDGPPGRLWQVDE